MTENAFDHLTALAAEVFDAPMAFVTVLEPDSQWIRSACGGDLVVTPRRDSFCTHTAEGGPGATLVVLDSASDPVFAAKPCAQGEGAIRFYAGAAITRVDGVVDGAMCVADIEPRPAPTAAQMAALQRLAALAAEQIAMLDRAAAERRYAEQLRLAEAMAGVGHFRIDLTTGQVLWSDEVYRIHGRERASFTPTVEAGVAAYHPDDRADVGRIVERAVATGEPCHFRKRLIRPDGELRIITCQAAAQREGQGAVNAIFGVVRDVTDSERAADEAARSQARYRLLAENSSDVIGEIDLDGINTFISPASERVTGWRPEDLVGRTTLDLIHPDDADRIKTLYGGLARARKARPDHPVEYRGRRPDGAYVWLEAQPTLVFDGGGRPHHFVDVVRNISARKAGEEALARALAEAEAAVTAKSEFLANMSHELRTPLTSIIGFSGLLRHFGSLNDQDRRFVDRIAAGAEALLAMVGDVLDYSRLEAGAVELHREPVEIASMLEETLALVGPAAAEKWLKLTVRIGPRVPVVLSSDRTRFRQVLLNLINNAVKFTREGEVTVRADMAIDGGVRFSIIDTGVGVPADRRDRLFKRFSQADGSTVRDYGGSGLGLAICKALVDAMGGEIGFDSVEGEGSTFWFTLPIDIVVEAADPVAQAA